MGYTEGDKSFVVGTADIGEALLVKLASGKLEINGASDNPIGATTYPVKIGENCTPKLRNSPGTVILTASAAIAAEAEIETAAGGKIVTKTTGTARGIALEAAAADGDQIECLLY